MSEQDLAARLEEYANTIERAPVHDDMGLSIAHTQTADALLEAAAELRRLEAQFDDLSHLFHEAVTYRDSYEAELRRLQQAQAVVGPLRCICCDRRADVGPHRHEYPVAPVLFHSAARPTGEQA